MAKVKATTEMEKATGFLTSIRGQFIMAQALHTAIKTLEKEPYPEFSNIEDMKYIKEYLFNFPVEFMDAEVVRKEGRVEEAGQMKEVSEEGRAEEG